MEPGLTNIGFMPPDSLVVEIFETSYMFYMYYVLSRMIGLKYECIVMNHRSNPLEECNANWYDVDNIMQILLRVMDLNGF
jgi:hypothetical protein